MPTPERLGSSSDWWSKAPIDLKLVKLGRTFTIARQRTSGNPERLGEPEA